MLTRVRVEIELSQRGSSSFPLLPPATPPPFHHPNTHPARAGKSEFQTKKTICSRRECWNQLTFAVACPQDIFDNYNELLYFVQFRMECMVKTIACEILIEDNLSSTLIDYFVDLDVFAVNKPRMRKMYGCRESIFVGPSNNTHKSVNMSVLSLSY